MTSRLSFVLSFRRVRAIARLSQIRSLSEVPDPRYSVLKE